MKILCFFLIVIFKVQSYNDYSFIKIIPNYLLWRKREKYIVIIKIRGIIGKQNYSLKSKNNHYLSWYA